MKRLINILILLTVFSSCSTIRPYKVEDRAPASFTVKGCFETVSEFFGISEQAKLRKAIRDLRSGDLKKSDYRTLEAKLGLIPYAEQRVKLARKLSAQESLGRDDLNLINTFIARDIDLGRSYPDVEYKRKFFNGDDELPLSYGVEFEFKVQENPQIVNSYRVADISQDDWVKMSLQERVDEALKAKRNADDINHILVRMDFADQRLPKGLFVEPHGTMEGNDMVFDNLGDYKEFMDFFVENFGRASFQSHVVFPSKVELNGLAGYTTFEFDRAQLKTLERGFERYLDNEKFIPAQNLIHHSLGPVDEKISHSLQGYEDNLANGNFDFVAHGTKAVYAPNFRIGSPYGKGLMGFELRQFHKRDQDMVSAVSQLANDLETYGSLSHYKKFDEASHVSLDEMRRVFSNGDEFQLDDDSVDNIELFFLSLSDVIKERIKKVGGARTGASVDVRLLYPLRDWAEHPIISNIENSIERDEVLERILNAQMDFTMALEKVANKYEVTEVTNEALSEVQVLIAKWASEVKLSELFEKYTKNATDYQYARPQGRLKRLEFFDYQGSTQLGENYRVLYKFKKSEGPDYENYLDNTIELFYKEDGRTGHVEIRVGKKIYGVLNHVKWFGTLVKNTTELSVDKGIVGRVYRMNRRQIDDVQEKIEAFINSANKYNFPPFDVYGSFEEVEKVGKYFKMKHSKNKTKIKAQLISENGKKYFYRDGVRVPAMERDGKIFIQTTNCTQSVMDILRDYLNMNVGNYNSASTLNSAFEKGSVKLVPDAVVEY
jgi:hypothetical protein